MISDIFSLVFHAVISKMHDVTILFASHTSVCLEVGGARHSVDGQSHGVGLVRFLRMSMGYAISVKLES